MSFAPQGIEKLSRWRKLLQYPLVAIGGISEDNIDTVAAVKVDGIAMISAISHAQNPLLAASKIMKKVTANAA
jgi:hydroxymethylpyrimidine kinase/phosphomethylpyrimidine kinase/thiamine-phosphate diphosphorylase